MKIIFDEDEILFDQTLGQAAGWKSKKAAKKEMASASPQEIAERRSELRTQGRKGAKALRINTAFTPENIDFIRTMAPSKGMTMTGFINYIIEKERKKSAELYSRIKKIGAEM